MHVITRLLGLTVLIMAGAAVTAFTPLLKTPITADGFFTVRDLVEEIVFPIVFAMAHFLIYVYLTGPLPSKVPSHIRRSVNLAGLVLMAGIVIATLGVGIRFVGDTLTTNFCAPPVDRVDWCAKAQLFHKELGHFGVFLGSLLAAFSLLICQLCRSEDQDVDRRNLAYVGLLGWVCGLGVFAIVIEGQISAVGLPLVVMYALAVMAMCLARRDDLRRLPLLSYQTIAAWVALTLLVAWGIFWRGFPSFVTVSTAIPK